jgi:hypothetical protein
MNPVTTPNPCHSTLKVEHNATIQKLKKDIKKQIFENEADRKEVRTDREELKARLASSERRTSEAEMY